MTSREAVARAVAFFEACDDPALLHEVLAQVAPRARLLVSRLLRTGTEESLPGPADLRAAREAASQEDAVATVRTIDDFALLQVLARAVGQRLEAIEIAASAEFPPGVRVVVPARPAFPPAGPYVEGTVEETGLTLQVILDDGETWEGPPSLARLGGVP